MTWATLVGPDVARRSRPRRSSTAACTSWSTTPPGSHELTLRGAGADRASAASGSRDPLASFHARRAARRGPRRRPRVRRPRDPRLTDDDTRAIDAAAAAISDPALAHAARRLMARAWPARGPEVVNHDASAPPPCASPAGRPARSPAARRPPARRRDPTAPRRRGGRRRASATRRPTRTTTTRWPRCSPRAAASRTRSRRCRKRFGAIPTRPILWSAARPVAGARRAADRGAGRRPPGRAARARRGPAAPDAGRAAPRRRRSTPRPRPSWSSVDRAEPRRARRRTSRWRATRSSRRRTTGRARTLLRLVDRQPRNVQAQFLLGPPRDRDGGLGRGDHAAHARRRARSRPRRRLDRARLRLRVAAPHRRGDRGLPAAPSRPTPTTRPSSSGWATCSSGSGRFKEAQAEVEALTELAPRDPRVWMKLGRGVLRAEAVGPRRRGLPPRGRPRALESARALLPGHDVHGRRPDAEATGGAGAHPPRRSALDRRPRAARRSCTAGPSATTRPSRSCARRSTSSPSGRSSSSTSARRTSGPSSTTAPPTTLQEGLTPRRQAEGSALPARRGLREAAEVRRRRPASSATSSRSIPSTPRPTTTSATCTPSADRTSTRPCSSSARRSTLEPDNGYFIDSLGWAYYQQGRYADALRELKRAVEKAKEDPVIFEHLGDALRSRTASTRTPLAAWEKSLQLDPAADGVKKKLEDLRAKLRRVQGERSKASQ